MKLILAVILSSMSAVAFCQSDLQPAHVGAVRSNGMFPVSSFELDAAIPCYSKVVGTVSTTHGDKIVLGVMLKNPPVGGIQCRGLMNKTFKMNVSTPVASEIIVLGAPSDIVIGTL